MKLTGILILIAGLILGAFALIMDVSVDVESRNFGYGITTPSMRVANVDLIAQRQNYLIFSGILAVVGAILTGFGSISPSSSASESTSSTVVAEAPEVEDTSNDHQIVKRDGMYVVGEYHFDTLTDARNFANLRS